MTCKSHVLLLVFATLGIAPAAVHTWGAHGVSVAAAATEHGAAIAESVHPYYRCGLGPMMMLVFGIGLIGCALLTTFVIGSLSRTSRIRNASPDVVSVFVAEAVLLLTRRVHYTACTLGLVAMGLSFGVDSNGCGLMLCMLSMIVAARGSACTTALRWLDRGATVERRANALIVRTTTETLTIHASRWLFDDAQRAVMPAATARVRG